MGSGLSGVYGTRNPGNCSYLISSSSALWPGRPSFILDCATTTNVVSCCCRSMEMTSSSLASSLSDDDDVGSGTTTVWIWKQSTKMWLKTGANHVNKFEIEDPMNFGFDPLHIFILDWLHFSLPMFAYVPRHIAPFT